MVKKSWDLGSFWRAERTDADYAHHYAERAVSELRRPQYQHDNRQIHRLFRQAKEHAIQANIFPHLRYSNITIDALEDLRRASEQDLAWCPCLRKLWGRCL